MSVNVLSQFLLNCHVPWRVAIHSTVSQLMRKERQAVMSLNATDRKFFGISLGIPFVFLTMITGLPALILLYNSFHYYNLVHPDSRSFIGLTNYIRIFKDPIIAESIFNTFYLVFGTLITQLPIGMGIALLLVREFPGYRIARTLFIIPLMVTPVVSGLLWRTMYAPELGIVNYFLSLFGHGGVEWLSNYKFAMPAVIIVDIFNSTSFVALIFMSGLLSFPKTLWEAAKVDGANAWQIFTSITLPWLKPIISIVIVFRLVDTFKRFDTIYIMTGGGPGNSTKTLNLSAYYEAFEFLNIGFASAICVLMVLISIIFASYMSKIFNTEEK